MIHAIAIIIQLLHLIYIICQSYYYVLTTVWCKYRTSHKAEGIYEVPAKGFVSKKIQEQRYHFYFLGDMFNWLSIKPIKGESVLLHKLVERFCSKETPVQVVKDETEASIFLNGTKSF